MQSSLRLSWRPSKDNRRGLWYRIYRNGLPVARSRAPSARLFRLRCGTRYRLGVAAYDRAGNHSRRVSVRAATRACAATHVPGPAAPPPPSSGSPKPPPTPPPPGPPPSGAVFYVSTSGSDSAAGSQSSPWRTVQKALNSVPSGATVIARPGTYAENLVFNRTLTAWTTVQGEPGAVLDGTSTHTLRVNESGRFLRLKGFRILGAPIGSGGCVDLYGQDLEIVENEITACGDQGVYLEEMSKRVTIARNLIHHWAGNRTNSGQSNGIYLQGDDHLVASNIIRDPNSHPKAGFGIQVYDYACRPTVVNNTIVNVRHAGIVVGGSGSGACGSGVSNATVVGNLVYGNDQEGIRFDSTAPKSCSIHHNLAFQNGGGGFGQFGGMFCASANLVADPLFENYGVRDLRLKTGAPRSTRATPPFGRARSTASAGR
jgi:Right handed beta helix region